MSTTTKTAISMPNELYEAAQRTAKERNIPFSTFISKCVEAALTGCPMDQGDKPGLPSSLPGEVSELRSIVDNLSARFSALESGLTLSPVEPVPLEEIPELPEGEKPAPRAITPDQAVLPISTLEHFEPVIPVIPKDSPNKIPRVKITDEMRASIVGHLNDLNAAGMIDAKIAAAAAVNKSLLSLIRLDATHDKQQKTITEDQYQALMSVKIISS